MIRNPVKKELTKTKKTLGEVNNWNLMVNK